MAVNHPTLFLHGGPGLSAGIERLWFGNSLPILWWDQPLVAGVTASPFGQLVVAATEQLRAMADEAGEPVALIAHSFGGRIAHALAGEAPDRVRSITLLGCPPNPFSSLFRLFRRMTEIQPSPALEDAIADAQRRLDKRSFETMALAAASHPAYPAVYFGQDSAAARDRFLDLLPQVRFLDPETFLAVMDKLLDAPALASAAGFDGPVMVLMGRHDPVLALEEDIAVWLRIFPQAQAQIVDAGHFLHLELPLEIWWERPQQGV